ncbi:CHAD domain-containing protein [Agromyces aurantiacus]|uniref:CHAD domain-containing protein n=1 Tax=Agromyces aurantiacus TaxID=165814 RepID=A0ABV9R8T1_9MICO|nr:CHAD domain-containing protein [Agromyces aurantiacus]MBM7504539.1 CHAD domain-containing protein [Agromyces aurantiacus]
MTDREVARLPSDADAGTAALAALRAIAQRMSELEPAALADEPDAVHQLRTQVRRLRSLLGAFGPVFDPSATTALRRRYGEFGRELGTVRDIEVRIQVAERSLEDASEHDPHRDVVADPDQAAAVRERLVDDEVEAHRLAHARFVERQAMPRAEARRDALAAFLAAPTVTPLAAGAAREVLGELIEGEARRALRRVRRLGRHPEPEALHDVRKAGRRLRYAAESVVDEPLALFGDRATKLAQAGEALHDVLGDHRDEVLFAEHVRRAGAHASHAGEPSAAFEALAAAADERARERLEQLDDAIDDLRSAAVAWAQR